MKIFRKLAPFAAAFALVGTAGAQEKADAVDNLAATAQIGAQAGPGVYRDETRDRRNALIALGAVGVAAAVAAGAFDSTTDHTPEPPPVTPPPSH